MLRPAESKPDNAPNALAQTYWAGLALTPLNWFDQARVGDLAPDWDQSVDNMYPFLMTESKMNLLEKKEMQRRLKRPCTQLPLLRE